MVSGCLALLAIGMLLLSPLAHAGLHVGETDHHGVESPVCMGDCLLCNAAVLAITAEHAALLGPVALVLAELVPQAHVERAVSRGTVRSGRAPPVG